ncbi:outer membrane lipoprotein chaperone LolA [Legionella hackeliae]|uniref:Outer-membrane lipoprotein carrier protein n=1 Tax=Legionella hackeliae TaxID=449 RepID=A0A0A8UWX1_LEGHA|nr:outer membrane lipoprotein chaperone LolA [Legionella hackeliae]KTD15384.1 outer membrane lipoprotein carrier protein [Legionella hackeliae]CEK11249.1 Outer-membrane lipoprotein carrier protein [Legionella hackeliae]STX48014.1 outer membrane lipoprotein carrier protein [Legionella hackeliae]
MKKIGLLGVLLLLSTTVFSDSAADLQTKLNSIRSMSANFSQVVKAKERELSSSSGKMALERPGRFRWETKDPMEQLVIADGEKLWVYDVDLEQVTVKKQEKGVGGTAALFLSGYDDTVARDFDVTATTKGKTQLYDLRSKSNKANFQRVKLIFTGEILSGIEMYDQLGQHTIVNLKNVKTNPKLATTLFKFKPPKGTDVVQQ